MTIPKSIIVMMWLRLFLLIFNSSFPQHYFLVISIHPNGFHKGLMFLPPMQTTMGKLGPNFVFSLVSPWGFGYIWSSSHYWPILITYIDPGVNHWAWPTQRWVIPWEVEMDCIYLHNYQTNNMIILVLSEWPTTKYSPQAQAQAQALPKFYYPHHPLVFEWFSFRCFCTLYSIWPL